MSVDRLVVCQHSRRAGLGASHISGLPECNQRRFGSRHFQNRRRSVQKNTTSKILLCTLPQIEMYVAPLQGCAVIKLKCWRSSLWCLVYTGVSKRHYSLILFFSVSHQEIRSSLLHWPAHILQNSDKKPHFYPERAAAAVILLCSPHLFLPFWWGVCSCPWYIRSASNTHSPHKVRTFSGGPDFLDGPHDFKGLLKVKAV